MADKPFDVVMRALDASTDRCARCKVCDNQGQAVLDALAAAGYTLVPPCCTCSISGIPHPTTALCLPTEAGEQRG